MAHQTQLSCNNLTCRASLSCDPVWVTLCGHIYCDRCGTDCNTNKVCISCRDTLGQDSIARKKSLNFGEEWKKLILAGLPPHTVMEVCTSAIQFYQNQTCNEVNLLEEKIRRMKGKMESVKGYYEGVIEQFKMEISTLEAKVADKSSSNSTSSFYSASSVGEGVRMNTRMGSGSDIMPRVEEGWGIKRMGDSNSDMNMPRVDGVFGCSYESSPSFVNLDDEVVDYGTEDQGDARPLRLIRTEVTEQNKITVNGQDVLLMEKSSVLDNLNNTKTTTRSAQSSYNQLPLLLARLRLAGKSKSSSKLDARREEGRNTKQMIPYRKRMV